VVEKWKVLESLLKGMPCLASYQYKYLGMNYSTQLETGRIRFEYIFRNAQTVWIGFAYYPQTRTKPDYLQVTIVSPFIRRELDLNTWIKKYSHKHDLSNFSQFAGDFKEQAKALVELIDTTLSKSGLDAVLCGRSGVDVPSLSLGV
jgi:hypothetical protein